MSETTQHALNSKTWIPFYLVILVVGLYMAATTKLPQSPNLIIVGNCSNNANTKNISSMKSSLKRRYEERQKVNVASWIYAV